MADEKTNGSAAGANEYTTQTSHPRIIPRFDGAGTVPTQTQKFWVMIGTHIKGFASQADAEAEAILAARTYPGQIIRVTRTVKAYRTKEPAVETLEVE